ncbi:MAG: DUF3467 domain-containing protein [Chloroflexota bacterium]
MPPKRVEETIASNGHPQTQPSTPTIKWDDSDITNSYANVCTVSSSREEVVLVFGVNKAWERILGDIQVKLSSRVILSPFAAKRLAMLLNNVVEQYEARFGVMDLSAGQAEKPVGK